MPLDAEVELLRETKRLVFLAGKVVQEGELVAAFSGALRKASRAVVTAVAERYRGAGRGRRAEARRGPGARGRERSTGSPRELAETPKGAACSGASSGRADAAAGAASICGAGSGAANRC